MLSAAKLKHKTFKKMKNSITLSLIFDYNFSEKFIMPELTEEEKNSLYWCSQNAHDKFFPKSGKTKQYWSLKDKKDFCRFAKQSI
jgi:hypothetical protein